jgi:hypothetical protein
MAAASEPIAVNTGPLIALSACGALHLLGALHAPVLVAEAVLAEFLRGGKEKPPLGLTGFEVHPLATPVPALLKEHLGVGEAAAIAIALERSVPLVAIDERRGRMVARALGLRVTGSVGILLRAKREGLIPAIKPHLDAMRAAGVWLGARLSTEALREANEE